MSKSPLSKCRQSFAALPLTAAISTAVSGRCADSSIAVAQLEEVVVTARARDQNPCKTFRQR